MGTPSGSGMGGTAGRGLGTPGTMSGRDDTVDLTGDRPLGSTTLPADDLIVPGDRSM